LQHRTLMVHSISRPPADVFLVGISLEGSPSFFLVLKTSFLSFGVHLQSHEYMGLNGRHPYSSIRVAGINTTGCCLVPCEVVSDTGKIPPQATQPSARCLTSRFRWTIALFAIFSDVTPLRDEDATVGFWRGCKFGIVEYRF
jgi:hypothetical protein